MKLPRDLTGQQLAKALATLGYTIDRQTGSHLRITTQENGEHHYSQSQSHQNWNLKCDFERCGDHFEVDRDELLKRLF